MSAPSFRAVIPSRFASTRLPGKPLLEIAGRPMIQHVWERACEAGAHEVLIATDDARIQQAAQGFGAQVVMTSADHASGTDRLAEVARVRGWRDEDIVVNLQGDEPLMPGALVAQVAGQLAAHESAGIATLAAPIREPAEVFAASAVKVVLDDRGYALYFSRAPIPWVRGHYEAGAAALTAVPTQLPVLRHVGLYAYRVKTLLALSQAPVSALEQAESLEQLRALALGIRIHVTVASATPPAGVDTPEDLARVRAHFSGS
jgi:3-deoxy-manno-octulosonate cytidylyltransferase (CMP-KDO synthetase)